MSEVKRQVVAQFLEIMESIYLQVHTDQPTEGMATELTMAQVRAITFLSTGTPKTSEIAAYLGVSPSSATSLVDRLVSKGLVERLYNPDDRRVVRCRLTPLGQEQLRRFWCLSTGRLESAASTLSLEEIKVLVHALEVFRAAIGRQSGPGLPGPGASSNGGGKAFNFIPT